MVHKTKTLTRLLSNLRRDHPPMRAFSYAYMVTSGHMMKMAVTQFNPP